MLGRRCTHMTREAAGDARYDSIYADGRRLMARAKFPRTSCFKKKALHAPARNFAHCFGVLISAMAAPRRRRWHLLFKARHGRRHRAIIAATHDDDAAMISFYAEARWLAMRGRATFPAEARARHLASRRCSARASRQS